ncbi:class F sortase [Modestobacter sp. VKM Ac-2977]|uniref:class F sortase n=1 Tax=Modestobacter sp. VKM Ac-2977 TaxID=3004131 RepID=UPI0022AA3087|nr:class F sortase [Modestobacter sp. VKM Ac-2977]MCZ2819559.1 class F sortase [Modestobacter sp. VKM Ac-2977]
MTSGRGRAVARRSVRLRLGALAALLALGATGCAGGAATAPAAGPAVTATSASAAPTPELPAVLAASVPIRVQIPAIGVDSELMDLGLQADGTMEVPAGGFPAGWYTGAPTPGERGPAVLAGHVDWGGAPGVFAELRDVVPGDEITVSRADGSTAVFAVREVGQYDKDDFPTAAVYGDLDHAGLRVITCGGTFDELADSYRDNTVVFADLVPPA